MEYGIETRCIHGAEGVTRDHSYGSMGTPIYQTATFSHPVWDVPLVMITAERAIRPEVNWRKLLRPWRAHTIR